MEPVIVIGAGLAGSEAAWQLAQRGVPVTLREMKPSKMTPAHHTEWFGDSGAVFGCSAVCSGLFRVGGNGNLRGNDHLADTDRSCGICCIRV